MYFTTFSNLHILQFLKTHFRLQQKCCQKCQQKLLANFRTKSKTKTKKKRTELRIAVASKKSKIEIGEKSLTRRVPKSQIRKSVRVHPPMCPKIEVDDRREFSPLTVVKKNKFDNRREFIPPNKTELRVKRHARMSEA